MKSLFSLLFVGAFLILGSCSKDNDQSRTELLTERAWIFYKVEVSENNGPYEDEARFWPSCEKDDELRFFPDGYYELTEGQTRCSPSDPDLLEDGRWELLDNDNSLDLGGDILRIDRLNEDELILSAEENDLGDIYRYRYTLRH